MIWIAWLVENWSWWLGILQKRKPNALVPARRLHSWCLVCINQTATRKPAPTSSPWKLGTRVSCSRSRPPLTVSRTRIRSETSVCLSPWLSSRSCSSPSRSARSRLADLMNKTLKLLMNWTYDVQLNLKLGQYDYNLILKFWIFSL